MNLEQKLKLLDQAMIESNWGNPNSKIVELPHWAQIITPNAKHSSANCVFRSRLSASDLMAKVTETVALYDSMNVPFRWLITPLTEPAPIRELLEKKGLKELYQATAMLGPVEQQRRKYDAKIRVIPADIETIDVYVETFVRSWKLPVHQIPEFAADVRYGLEHGANRFLPFIAYFENEPVGTAALLNIPSGGYLAAGTVDERYRGKGIYKAMVSHRAQVAGDLGHQYLLIHAKNQTSAPICTALGFERIYDYSVLSKEV
jgi:GNAT superfamily N-acetyltransferase